MPALINHMLCRSSFLMPRCRDRESRQCALFLFHRFPFVSVAKKSNARKRGRGRSADDCGSGVLGRSQNSSFTKSVTFSEATTRSQRRQAAIACVSLQHIPTLPYSLSKPHEFLHTALRALHHPFLPTRCLSPRLFPLSLNCTARACNTNGRPHPFLIIRLCVYLSP